MKQKGYDYVPSSPGESDFKDHSIKHNLSNYDYDLFKEENDVINPVFRVKKINLPNKGESWKLFKDNKVVEVIEGVKLNSKEKDFLKTVEGIQFVIKYYKSGWKSFSNFRKEMKNHLKA